MRVPRIVRSAASIAVLLFAPCSSLFAEEIVPPSTGVSNQTASTAQAGEDPTRRRLSVGKGLNKGATGYFVLIENDGTNWKVIEISSSRQQVRDYSRQEVLYFSSDLTMVQPDFRTFIPARGDVGFVCWTGALRRRVDNATTDYNPCESSLTKTLDANLAGNALFAVGSLGLGLLTGTTNRVVGVDDERVMAVITQANVLGQVVAIKSTDERQRAYQAYRADYSKASDEKAPPSSLQKFIEKYTSPTFDPDNLLPIASQLLAERLATQEQEIARKSAEAEQKRKADEAQAQAQAQADAAKAQADVATAIADMRKKQEESKRFRMSMRVESVTNCGPIVEIRGNLIKVYVPVANYGNEHWIPRGQLFPPGYGCSFFNGQYQPPYGF